MREALARLKEHKSDVYVPLTSHFPNDGEGGLTEQIRSFAGTAHVHTLSKMLRSRSFCSHARA